MNVEQIERALQLLGVRNADSWAAAWDRHGFGADEMVGWLHAGVSPDEPHIAAALSAAEWTPELAARRVRTGEPLTFVDAVRQHPNGAVYARELRWAV